MRGGMMSGWAASRAGQLSDTASQLSFGGYKGGHRPRWPIPRPQDALRKANCHVFLCGRTQRSAPTRTFVSGHPHRFMLTKPRYGGDGCKCQAAHRHRSAPGRRCRVPARRLSRGLTGRHAGCYWRKPHSRCAVECRG